MAKTDKKQVASEKKRITDIAVGLIVIIAGVLSVFIIVSNIVKTTG
jgi:hypothetical protein